jgi:hypothetical protein
MGFLLAVSRVYLPRSVRRNRLDELFRAAAEAFQQPAPRLEGYSLDRCLTEFALFTAENAQQAIQLGCENETRERLYLGARQIGQNIRAQLHIRTLAEVMQACEVIYKALKIEFRGDSQGQICIRRCFFSGFYTADVCRVISGLDAGLLAGLSGDLKLQFSYRITEGQECCRARLLPVGNSR